MPHRKISEFFREVFEEHTAMMLLLDPQTQRILSANRAAAEFYGYSEEEMRDMPLAHINPMGKHVLDHNINQIVNKDPSRHFIVTHKLANGELRTLRSNSSPIEVEGRLMLFSIIHDITQEVRQREELEHKNQALELNNRELREFVYVASHDLQEPLRKITIFGERLQKKYASVLDQQGNDYIHRMTGAAARMSTLISDLLAYSRLSTQPNPIERIELKTILEEVLSDLEIALRESQATVELPAEIPALEADPTQMRQIFQNLIANAIKFHRDEEPPHIIIEANLLSKEQTRGEAMLELVFEDNGIGFEQEYAQNIFLPFHRLHGKKEYPGTGIGLAICRKIVERHRGSIQAFSAPDDGATFVIRLPLKQPR